MAYPQESPVCWAINHFRLVDGNPIWWPAIRCNPEDVAGQAPPYIPDRVLVRYAGPPAMKGKIYDCYWITPGEVWNYREAREYVLSKQLDGVGRHMDHLQRAMEEAAKYDRTIEDVNNERLQMEQELADVIGSIPLAPRTAFQTFAQDRLDQVQVSGALTDITAEDMQNQFIEEFSAMPPEQQANLDARGQEEFHMTMQNAHMVIRQLGPVYLQLCEELNEAPADQLVPAIQLTAFPPMSGSRGASPKGAKRPREDDVAGVAVKEERDAGSLAPADLSIKVMCNEMVGTLFPATCKVVVDGKEMTATQFEQYSGAASAKKWKTSLRVIPGQVKECPQGAAPMQVGKWLEIMGWVAGGSRHKVPKLDRRRAHDDFAPPPASAAPPAAALKLKEDEVPPWERMNQGHFEPVRVKWSGDRCAVCDSEIDYDTDQLIHCHGCGIAVHQSCYGVRQLPAAEDMWMCRACEVQRQGKPRPHCVMCPVEGGALKETTIPGTWCHLACMQWIPELGVVDTTVMEPIQGIEAISRDRWNLQCSVCKQRVGAKIQCNKCYTAFHPLCGRLRGLTMDMLENPAGPHLPLVTVVYCHKHCTPQAQGTGVQYRLQDKAVDEGEGAPGDGLVHGFPYTMPPAATLPLPPAGAARLQPMTGLVRMRDGTGIGDTTKAGWWIPGAEDAPKVAKGAPAKPKVPRARKHRPSGAGRPAARQAPKGPPVPTELVPLPPGVDEEIDVFCNGKTGVMKIRVQRVVYEGDEMPPSRFEQVCGKGDAKKWKATLFHYDAIMQKPTMSMQDYLTTFRLDRATLTRLKDNHDAYQDWTAWVARGGGAGDGDAADGAAAPLAEGDLQPAASLAPASTAVGNSETQHGGEGNTSMDDDDDDGGDDGATHGAVASTRAASSAPGATENGACHGDGDGEGRATSRAPGDVRRASVVPAADGVWRAKAASLVPLGAEATLFSYDAGQQEHVAAVRAAHSGVRDAADPASWVGRCVRVHWPDDEAWYSADVMAWLPEARRHRVLYHEDDETEELDLVAEQVAGRLQWLSGLSAEAWQPPPAPDVRSAPAAVVPARAATDLGSLIEPGAAAVAHAAALPGASPLVSPLMTEAAAAPGQAVVVVKSEYGDSGAAAAAQMRPPLAPRGVGEEWQPTGLTETGAPIPEQDDALGWRIEVYWDADKAWYGGIVDSFDPLLAKFRVHYDDGEREWADLSMHAVKWLAPHAEAAAARAREGYARALQEETGKALAAAQAEADVRARAAPSHVRIVCNNVYADFDVRSNAVMTAHSGVISPTEFERLSGKGSAKKWKGSIRVVDADGNTGITIGDWLVQNGLEVSKTALVSSLHHRRRTPNRRSLPHGHVAATAAARFSNSALNSKKRHRSDCSCIICKQARRKTGDFRSPFGEAAPSALHTAGPASKRPAPAAEAPAGRPAYRIGKHAYLLSTAYLPGGCKPPGDHHVRVPPCRAWHPTEWRLYWQLCFEVDRQTSSSGAAPVGPVPLGLPAEAVDSAAAGAAAAVPLAIDAALLRALQPPGPASSLPAVMQAGMLAQLGLARRDGDDAVDGALRLGVTSVRDKVAMCLATERERLTFNKSGIHGWGLTARRDIPQDSMILEYRGEVLRPALQDVKEKLYQKRGVDVYLFALTQAVLVDATTAGTIARFTNAACQPCMYSKILDVDGQPTLMFFARTDIKAGQELTYDYRFKAQEGADRTPCLCGAPACRGTLEV